MNGSAVVVIPSRYASTRFPGKPLADIGGRSMVRRVWEQCSKARMVSRVIVATDDERICDHVSAFGGEAMMTPSSLQSGTERVAYVADRIEGELFVNVQGDEPLIPPDVIDSIIEPLTTGVHIDITTAASPLLDASELGNPNVVKVVMAKDGRAIYFSRAPVPFMRNGGGPVDGLHWRHIGIYGFTRASLAAFADMPCSPVEDCEKLEQLRALESGMRIQVVHTGYKSIAVDVPGDVDLVLQALRTGA
jgi:3-deoxy-manno-octulosonate cytidylyltransferase (CMP-KDO synthetase)